MTLRTHTLHASFLWADLGWLDLRLCPTPTGAWVVFASTNSGPWHGTWALREHRDRAPLAQWMAALTPDDARFLLLRHPPFAQALAP